MERFAHVFEISRKLKSKQIHSRVAFDTRLKKCCNKDAKFFRPRIDLAFVARVRDEWEELGFCRQIPREEREMIINKHNFM